MNIEEELIENTNDAFLSASVPNTLEDGLKLEPYSIMRQAFAISLGVRHGGEDAFFDSVIIAWLCTLDEDAVLDTRNDKRKAIKDAFHWAQARGYSLANYDPLLKVYTKVLNEILGSSNAVLSENGTHEKNSGGQPAR